MHLNIRLICSDIESILNKIHTFDQKFLFTRSEKNLFAELKFDRQNF